MLWSRVNKSVGESEQTISSSSNLQENNELAAPSTLSPPDWLLLSPAGFLQLIRLTTRMLTLSTQNCISLFSKTDPVIFDTLSYILSDLFLLHFKKSYSEFRADNQLAPIEKQMSCGDNSPEQLAGELIISICQIISFPFAIDASEEVITRTYMIIKDFNLLMKILSACLENNSVISMDVPFGLITRLVLTDEDLSQLLITQLNSSVQVIFIIISKTIFLFKLIVL